MGTIAALFNVSLAVYYYFRVKLGWSEPQTKEKRPWLFAWPIVVGMIFAFAGIPSYNMVRSFFLPVIDLCCSNLSSFIIRFSAH